MNNMFQLIRERSLWLVSTAIILLFLVVPFGIFKYAYVLGVFFMTITLYMAIFSQRGFVLVIFAYSLMLPYGEVDVNTGFSRYVLYISVALIWLITILFKKSRVHLDFSYVGLLMTLLALISIVYALDNGMSFELRNMLYYIISTAVFFYLCFCDRLTLLQFYWLVDIIFYFTFFYVIQDSIFHNSPYEAIYNGLSLDFQLRAKGLMGHPLLLSSFITFYQVTLLTRVLIFKQWNILNFLLLIPIIVLSASKTLIVLILASWILYILLSRSYRNIRLYIGAITLIVLGFQIFPFFQLFTDTSVQRILDSSADQRLGSYSIAWQIFSNNLFGIGMTTEALKMELGKAIYQLNSNYDKAFLIFDNAYLTAAASFGFLCILIFIIYLIPLRYFRKLKLQHTRPLKSSLIMLFVIWFLQNFSFDSYQYFSVNAFYFLISALIIKESAPLSGLIPKPQLDNRFDTQQ